MTVNAKFFQPVGAGDGSVDPLRILSVPGEIANDLDPRVLFTARGIAQPAFLEERAWRADGNNPNNAGYWEPGFLTDRTYAAPPLVLASFENTDGSRFYPSFRGGFYLFRVVVAANGDGRYVCIAQLRSNQSAQTPRPGGLLKINVIGRT